MEPLVAEETWTAWCQSISGEQLDCLPLHKRWEAFHTSLLLSHVLTCWS
jgi:hypothetical protein